MIDLKASYESHKGCHPIYLLYSLVFFFASWYSDFCFLNHLQRQVVVRNGKGLINSSDFVFGQLPTYTAAILSSTLRAAILRNREDVAVASQKVKRNLPWSATVWLSDLSQYSTTTLCGEGKLPCPNGE